MKPTARVQRQGNNEPTAAPVPVRAIVAALAILGIMATADSAWASSPSLSIITPRGLQRGAETVLTFNGGNLADAQEILFYSKGFEVVKLEPSAGAVKATIKVSADCRKIGRAHV